MTKIYFKKYAKWILLSTVLLIISAYMVINQNNSQAIEQTEADLKNMIEDNTTKTAEVKSDVTNDFKNQLFVDVKGAVVHEGVYKVNQGERVIDVINIAGGFTEIADKDKVNLAALLQDEMVVYIPEIGENNQNILIGQNQSQTGKGKININQARQEDLETLPGIGPSKAMAIISYREEHGLFQTIEDIMNVSGIGKSTFANLKEDIDVK